MFSYVQSNNLVLFLRPQVNIVLLFFLCGFRYNITSHVLSCYRFSYPLPIFYIIFVFFILLIIACYGSGYPGFWDYPDPYPSTADLQFQDPDPYPYATGIRVLSNSVKSRRSADIRSDRTIFKVDETLDQTEGNLLVSAYTRIDLVILL